MSKSDSIVEATESIINIPWGLIPETDLNSLE